MLKRVREERLQNPNIHGLLDGEVAAEYGEVEQLINCTKTIFTLDSEDFEGIIFISFHELENVIICHSRISAFAVNNVRMRQLGQLNKLDVESMLITFARRYYIAALFKYTSAHLLSIGLNSKILDVNNFRSDKSIFTEIKSTKKVITGKHNICISDFMKELFKISKITRKFLRCHGTDQSERNKHIVRLADGKSLFNKCFMYWQIDKRNEGQLVDRVRESQFAREFRDELISNTIS